MKQMVQQFRVPMQPKELTVVNFIAFIMQHLKSFSLQLQT
jgi:hypothetical protein